MPTPTPTFFKTDSHFRRWLEKHHAVRTELFVGIYKKGSGKAGMTYREAVDVALCYGWIDGVLQPIDAVSYMQRFTPRKQTSYWSAINLKKVEVLQEQGLMHPAGLAALARRPADSGTRYAFEAEAKEFPAAYLKRFKQDRKAWVFFEQQPPGYRRQVIHRVMTPKREETRARRLEKLMQMSAAGKRW
jgi:uncharacterized protein YdeI (YjbR/CyaY-like superfamily)